jgi:long-subunit acyl-CoA synthetase (AMP-forming)
MESAKPYVRWEPVKDEPKQRSLIIRGNCPALATGISNRPDGDYDTNDLFMEVSEGADHWRYLGRKDDTLAMKNGEKTNPVPMEAAIRAAPIVKLCTVIGEGRECTGSLIELDQDHAFSYTPQEMTEKGNFLMINHGFYLKKRSMFIKTPFFL